jgi:5-formyltetrahydrofolate cyclo-ligase
MGIETKHEIRKRFLKIREQIPPRLAGEKSRRIAQTVQQLDHYQEATTIHCYASMKSRNEVDTFSLIESTLSMGKTIVVPVMRKGGELIHSRLESIEGLRENSFGVPEPVTADRVEISSIELVIVPMVAGDLDRNRIGYGAGYYDRFLAQTDAMTIGILFEEQVSLKRLPAESFDIPLKMLITDKRIIQ